MHTKRLERCSVDNSLACKHDVMSSTPEPVWKGQAPVYNPGTGKQRQLDNQSLQVSFTLVRDCMSKTRWTVGTQGASAVLTLLFVCLTPTHLPHIRKST